MKTTKKSCVWLYSSLIQLHALEIVHNPSVYTQIPNPSLLSPNQCGLSLCVGRYSQNKAEEASSNNPSGMHICFVILLLLSSDIRFVHPRFGLIKSIRTIRAVQKDEELTVAYGYDHKPSGKSELPAPDWYTKELREFQERNGEMPASTKAR